MVHDNAPEEDRANLPFELNGQLPPAEDVVCFFAVNFVLGRYDTGITEVLSERGNAKEGKALGI